MTYSFVHLLLSIIYGSVFVERFGGGYKLDIFGWIGYAFLIGFLIESMLIFALFSLGVRFAESVFIVNGLLLIVATFLWLKWGRFSSILKPARPNALEYLLLLFVAERVVFSISGYSLIPMHFSDALSHWGGRSRALYGEINWSFDQSSVAWLGHVGREGYPLGSHIWKATTSILASKWDDWIARMDSLFFFLALVAMVRSSLLSHRLSRNIAAGSVLILLTMPLLGWNLITGYSDIAVAAFVTGSFSALLNKNYFLAGMFLAGTVWVKNDGLVLFLPAIFFGAFLMLFFSGKTVLAELKNKYNWLKLAEMVSGFLFALPWFVFKIMYGLGIDPHDQTTFGWHEGSPGLFVDKVIASPNHSILWIGLTALVVLGTKEIFSDIVKIVSLAVIFIYCAMVFIVFSFTNAHDYLVAEVTIHRSILQAYGIVCIFMGLLVGGRVGSEAASGRTNSRD